MSEKISLKRFVKDDSVKGSYNTINDNSTIIEDWINSFNSFYTLTKTKIKSESSSSSDIYEYSLGLQGLSSVSGDDLAIKSNSLNTNYLQSSASTKISVGKSGGNINFNKLKDNGTNNYDYGIILDGIFSDLSKTSSTSTTLISQTTPLTLKTLDEVAYNITENNLVVDLTSVESSNKIVVFKIDNNIQSASLKLYLIGYEAEKSITLNKFHPSVVLYSSNSNNSDAVNHFCILSYCDLTSLSKSKISGTELDNYTFVSISNSFPNIGTIEYYNDGQWMELSSGLYNKNLSLTIRFGSKDKNYVDDGLLVNNVLVKRDDSGQYILNLNTGETGLSSINVFGKLSKVNESSNKITFESNNPLYGITTKVVVNDNNNYEGSDILLNASSIEIGYSINTITISIDEENQYVKSIAKLLGISIYSSTKGYYNIINDDTQLKIDDNKVILDLSNFKKSIKDEQNLGDVKVILLFESIITLSDGDEYWKERTSKN